MRPTFVTISLRPWFIITVFLGTVGVLAFVQGTAKAPSSEQAQGPLVGTRVVVDPGHGGVDGGCSQDSLFEKNLNLAVGLGLQQNLTTMGAAVKMTRTTDEALIPWGTPGGSRHRRDLAARVQVANEFHAQAYVALHANAGPPRLGGALTFYRKGDAESMRLAALIQERLSPLVPGNQNGILPAKFMVLAQVTAPAVLVEMGFLTNSQDRLFLSGSDAPSLLAKGIGTGIEAFAKGEVPVKPTFSPFPVPEGDDPDWSVALPYPGCSVNQSAIAAIVR